MNRLITLGVGILALAGMTLPSAAADMPVKAPPAPMMAPPILTWSGFYAGVGLGARDLEADWHTTSISFPPIPGDPFSTPVSFSDTNFRVSGYFGYNWQFATWLLGIEGDFGWADNKVTNAGIPGTFDGFGALFGPGPLAATLAVDASQIKADWDASIRGRIGFLAGPSVLLYATGGAAWLNVEASASCLGTLASWCVAVRSESFSKTLFGWTVGGGIEWMFAPNWIARGEYRFSDYGSHDRTFFATAPIDQVTANIDVQTHTAYFGISYLFR
jgi:outer membrane immunogenic protein